MGKIFCYKCGSIIPAGAVRCPNCGSPAPLSSEELEHTSSRQYRRGASLPEQSDMAAGSRTSPAALERMNTVVATEIIRPEQAPLTEKITIPDVKPAQETEPVPTEIISPETEEPRQTKPEAQVHEVSEAKTAPAPAALKSAPRHAAPSGKKTRIWSSKGVVIAGLAAIVLLILIFIIGKFISSSVPDPQAQTLYAISEIPLYGEPSENVPASYTVPFSVPLSVNDVDDSWSRVRYNVNGTEISGYVPARYLIDQQAATLLFDILHTGQARRMVPSPAERLALLNYFMYNLTEEERSQYSLAPGEHAVARGHFVNQDGVSEDFVVLLLSSQLYVGNKYVFFTPVSGQLRPLFDGNVTAGGIDAVYPDPDAPYGVGISFTSNRF